MPSPYRVACGRPNPQPMLTILMTLVPQTQAPDPGIAQELARVRAALISDIRYELLFHLDEGAREVTGEATLTFQLAEAPREAPVVLDFDGERIEAPHVNGVAVELPRVADHLLLPANTLAQGRNEVRMRFASRVAPTGTPLSVYHDGADSQDYFYTLVVPADAHRLYPCFDQPDLKARFSIRLDTPVAWQATSNGRTVATATRSDRRQWVFAETHPLPTYLMAFAAGPFDVVELPAIAAPGVDATQPTRLFVRANQRPQLDVEVIDQMHRDGLIWLADYFGVDYPFDKLDAVLLPGFPYGGMEHAGTIFYREQALLFDHEPTAGELVRRSTLIYHELSHQWFGNLVTMRWFDDLWLKEGFATFVGYQCMQALEPERKAWLRFMQRVKPRAYEVDSTPGTTPVFQELKNLADAKSAYGAIVYNKAPAVLRQLSDALGGDVFRKGLEQFLRQHSYGNATWRDLAASLQAASERDLNRWSERWLMAPSMPRVRLMWQTDENGKVTDARLLQRPIGGEGTWPLQLQLLVLEADGSRRTLTVRSDSASETVPQLVGRPAPHCVLVNPTDVAYGQFLLDDVSRSYLLQSVTAEPDPLLRAVMTTALYESVREAELDPAQFAEVALRLLRTEGDPDTHAWLLGSLGTCLWRYMPDERAAALRATTVDLLLRLLEDGQASGRELTTFRFLARNATDPRVLELCERVARGDAGIAGLDPGKRDRFLGAAALLAAGLGDDAYDHLVATFEGQDIGKERFLADAARPTQDNKAAYWHRYMQLEDPPEQWTQDSLGWFHWRGQGALTLPYLPQALTKVRWVKQNRRIFFMPAWLDAFVNAHSTAEALEIVDRFLAEADLEADVRQKLQQSRDGLARAVRIRAAF